MKKFANTNVKSINHTTSAFKTPAPEYLLNQILRGIKKATSWGTTTSSILKCLNLLFKSPAYRAHAR